MTTLTNNYFFDSTVLIDYFANEETDSELERLRIWVEDVIADPSTIIHTNTVAMLEFAKFLFYQKVTLKKIKNRVRYISIQYNISVSDYESADLWESIDKFSRIKNDSTLECHAGELSLLPFTKDHNSVYVSSDKSALRSFMLTDRVNPRKSPFVTTKGNEYAE
jgi:hypothetical protein